MCPCRPFPLLKRYCISLSINGSASERATRQLRASPGGGISSSRRSCPELPPSSATVTTAVIWRVLAFKPRSSVARPVPPPMATILGPRRRVRYCCRSWSRRFVCRPPRTPSTIIPYRCLAPKVVRTIPRVKKIRPRTGSGNHTSVAYRTAVKKPDESLICRTNPSPRATQKSPTPTIRAHRLMPIPGCSRSDRADGAR